MYLIKTKCLFLTWIDRAYPFSSAVVENVNLMKFNGFVWTKDLKNTYLRIPFENLVALFSLPSLLPPQTLFTFFIGPEYDHWLPLSLTNSLTDCCLVDLIDVTLWCEDANSKLVKVVIFADVVAGDCVGSSLLQIWKLMFGQNAKLLFRLWAKFFVKI